MPRIKIARGAQLCNEFNKETFVFTHGIDDPDNAAFDVILQPGGSGGGNALEHVHPLADEHFTVRRGAITVSVGGVRKTIQAGETMTVPHGAAHFFMNAVDETTEITIRFTPAGQQLRYFANFAYLASRRTQWFAANGAPHFLLMALVLSTYKDCLYLSRVPVPLQKLLFAVCAPIARMKGYRVEIEPFSEDEKTSAIHSLAA